MPVRAGAAGTLGVQPPPAAEAAAGATALSTVEAEIREHSCHLNTNPLEYYVLGVGPVDLDWQGMCAA